MAYYEKDEKYILEVSEELMKDRDFRSFSQKFSGFSIQEKVQMYFVREANKIKEFDDLDVTKEEKMKSLETIGEFLNNTKALNNLRKQYNKDILNKTRNELGDENSNPLVVTKKELKNEFSKQENNNLSEATVDMKLAFWENKVTKQLDSIKNSDVANYCKLYKKDQTEVKKNVRNMNMKLAAKAPNFANVYDDFLNEKISKEEFEKTEEFQKIKSIIKKNEERTGLKCDPYMLLNNASISKHISRSYLEKDLYIKNLLTSKDPELNKKAYKDLNGNSKFMVAGFEQKGFNQEVQCHYAKDDFEIVNKTQNIELINLESHYKPVRTVVLHRFTGKKLEDLKKVIDNKKMYSRDMQKVINQFAKTIDYKYEKEQTKDNQKEKFRKDLESKTYKNRDNKYNNDRNRNDRNRNNRYDKNRNNKYKNDRYKNDRYRNNNDDRGDR